MPNDPNDGNPEFCLTPLAIGLTFAIGVAVGVFVYASAVPALVGWFVALVCGFVVSGVLSILATNRYALVGFGYAAGVAAACGIAGLVFPQSDPDWSGALFGFAIIFAIVSLPSQLGAGLCALLKWEDKRARAKNQ